VTDGGGGGGGGGCKVAKNKIKKKYNQRPLD
jgi:hypothetical protein